MIWIYVKVLSNGKTVCVILDKMTTATHNSVAGQSYFYQAIQESDYKTWLFGTMCVSYKQSNR